MLEKLRAPGGCAWDAEQTHESLVQYLVEETYELVEAIERGNRDEMIEELGDVLYQVVFHSDIAAHTPGEDFTLEDVAANMTAKMIGRHPHVFGDSAQKEALNIQSGSDVSGMWDELKQADKSGRTSVLDGIPQSMPALALADKVLAKAEKIGIIDASAPGALALSTEEELGGVLLAIVTSARLNGLDSERALRTVLRELLDEIRDVEQNGGVDAGVIGMPSV